jgi:hypothetical protein
MEELIIEEKKYISSKRAAKVTGYAKDYIGQLCREGRVPARLVGRGWYVLETAIQDHRFGNPGETEPKEQESPRYKASPEEILPPIEQTEQKEPNISQNIQDSWREWFDRVEPVNNTVEAEEPRKSEENKEEEEKIEEKNEEGINVSIPIHTIYQPLPAELLPHRSVLHLQSDRDTQEMMPARRGAKKGNRRVLWITIKTVGVLLAVITAVTAVIGTGYFDKSILSSSQASFFAGVLFYNR